MRTAHLKLLATFGFALSVSLGGAAAQEGTAAATAETTAAAAPAETAGGGTQVQGSIKFEGKAPKMRKIKMKQELVCHAQHEEPVREERVVVNENGTLKNIFVYVKSGLPEGKSWPASSEPKVLNQQGCQYVPHVLGIQVGQPLRILNSDKGVLHNIHAFGGPGNSFNIGQPGTGIELKQDFKKSEVMVRVKCDVHGWMSSFIGVLDHPFFDVTEDDGTFQISGLPAGEYELEAWSEEYGAQQQKVTVAEGGTAEASFTFKAEEKAGDEGGEE